MDPARNLIRRYKIIVALLITVLIAIAMTILSFYLYIRSGVSVLDLSRPGYESVREQVQPKTPTTEFDATGPVNPDVIDKFHVLYEEQKTGLNATDNFSNQNLEDANLRFTPETQTTNPQ